MSHLLRVDASIRREDSVSKAVAGTFQRAWAARQPTGTVTVRDLAADPLPYLTESDAQAGLVPPEQRTPHQRAAAARASALYDELAAADIALLSVPLYNWGTPALFKTWIDHLFAEPRVLGGQQPLSGRPAVVVSARGGSYQPGTPREGWDHVEPYLRHALGEHLGLELHVITPEFTLAEVNPALAQFKEHARKSLARSHEDAERIAGNLAGA